MTTAAQAGTVNGAADVLDDLLGSPGYMAPEAHERNPIVKQSDLYSAGLVGLEMLRGVPLITDPNASEEEILMQKRDLPNHLDELLPPYVRVNYSLMNSLRGLLEMDVAKRSSRAEQVESGQSGLSVIHRQLTKIGKDTEYDRELQDFIAHWVDPNSDRVVRPALP